MQKGKDKRVTMAKEEKRENEERKFELITVELIPILLLSERFGRTEHVVFQRNMSE